MNLIFECSFIGISHCPVWFTCFQSKTCQNSIFQPCFARWWKDTPSQEAERTLDHHPTPALMLDNSMTLWISMIPMFCGSHPHACWNFEINSAEHISISMFSLAMSPCCLQPPSCVEIKSVLMASLGGPARNESSLIFSILRCLVLNPYKSLHLKKSSAPLSPSISTLPWHICPPRTTGSSEEAPAAAADSGNWVLKSHRAREAATEE